MIPKGLADLFREKIQAHLQTGIRLEKLAEEICVRPTVLRSLIADDVNVICSLGDCFLLARYFIPDQMLPTFKRFVPEYADELHRVIALQRDVTRSNEATDQNNSPNIANKIFQSLNHYRVYLAILSDNNLDDISRKFGEQGLAILNEFIGSEVVSVLSDGSILTSTEHSLVLGFQEIKRQAEFHIKLLNANINKNWIWTRFATISETSAEEIKELMAECRRKVWNVIAANVENGTYPVHVTMLFGQDFDTEFELEERVNNYRKAYDLDEVTASKVAMIAHDMHGPLGYLANYMEKMQAKHHMDADFHLARSAMNRVNSMVQCFKDLNGSSIIVRRKEVMYLDECRDLAESYALQTKKSLEYTGSLQVEGELDSEKLDRALQNLIINAFEAARTKVRVEVVRRDMDLILRVSDDGPGIAQASLTKLFQKGFTEGKKGGTGLGLAFVKHVVDGHGGDVTYERSPEEWTVFTMTVPHVFFDGLIDAIGAGSHQVQEPKEAIEILPHELTQKPLLLVLIDFPYMTRDKIEFLRQALPDYEVSSSYDDIPRAWFICFDGEDSNRDYILESKLNAVWMPEESSLRSSRFLETLKGMALHELKKFQKLKAEVTLSL
jgi:signal transduction histidine kinase